MNVINTKKCVLKLQLEFINVLTSMIFKDYDIIMINVIVKK